jgi:hypothetical protein
MSAKVVDLLARRAARRETVLHFDTAVVALEFAAAQVSDLQAKSGTALLITAEDLELPLAQLAAVLLECRRVCAQPANGEAR